MTASTMPEYLRPIMAAPSLILPYCAVCGRTSPLNQHHVVKRSDGELFDEHGRKLRKPTVTLCGMGNASGCHGLAHAGLLFLDYRPSWHRTKFARAGEMDYYGGHWEALLLTPEERDEWQEANNGRKLDLLAAREMEGWFRIPVRFGDE